MKSSFSFCGVDIEEFGLNYAPELADTYAYAPGETQVHEETFDGHEGGYYYGAWRQPKEFRLRCYFENKQIDHGIMANIYELFRVGNSGKLVFSRRPWCYYNVRVSAPIEPDFSNYLNGIIVITMKAYYPYARSDVMCDSSEDLQILTNTAFLDSEDKIPSRVFTNINQKTTQVILYNPGTEPCPVAISIAGDTSGDAQSGYSTGAGFKIHNLSNGQKCKFVNITSAITPAGQGAEEEARVVCDSLNGKVIRIDNQGRIYSGYLYHQEGFIYLQPAFPINRDIYIKQVYSDTIIVHNMLYSNYVGQYIYISKETKGEWYKIISQPDMQTLVVDRALVAPVTTFKTTIARMNELELSFTDTVGNIRKLEFLYKPAFA